MSALNAALAADTVESAASAPAAKSEKAPPIPLHQIEGNGGFFATQCAYLVNPARGTNWLGYPSLGMAYVNLGHERNLTAITLTETIKNRVEFGYAYNRFDSGDLRGVLQGLGLNVRDRVVDMQNANLRLQLIHENEWAQQWLPAMTAGVHYKYNHTIKGLDRDLGGALGNAGIRDNDGVDATFYLTKMLGFLPRPVLLNAGMRATEAAHLGLLGFTGGYDCVFEGSVEVLLTPWLALAAEYRQKPSNYQPIGSLVGREDDWWTLDAAFVLNPHLTVAVGYGHFGRVLNHEANGSWGVTTKWEF